MPREAVGPLAEAVQRKPPLGQIDRWGFSSRAIYARFSSQSAKAMATATTTIVTMMPMFAPSFDVLGSRIDV